MNRARGFRHSTLFLVSSLLGCTNGIGGIPISPTGVDGMVTSPVFREDGTLLHPRADDDGDGIPNQDEVDGYTITVDVNGFAVVDGAEALEVRRVTSDPRYRDSDGDGVDDARERMVTSDPRRQDTDGDTLSDGDEIDRYGTSPVSIDTDGDARGGDPMRPRPPLFALFDAAELRLIPNPIDPEGPFVPGRGATNPRDPDTDGDGLNDYEELFSGRRRATIAEVPAVGIRATPGSELTLGFNVRTREGTTDSSTYTVTRDTDEAVNTNFSSLSQTSQEVSASIVQYGNVSVGCCFDVLDLQVGMRVTTSIRSEQVFTMDASTEYSHALTTNNERVQEASRTSDVTITGGVIRMSVDVTNDGVVPYRLSDLAFGVYFNDRDRGPLVPLTELTTTDAFVLAPGDRRTIVLSRTDIEVEPMRVMMRDPSRVIVRSARYNVAGSDATAGAFRLEDVRGRAAHVVIDFGDGRVVRADVATPGLVAGRLATVGSLLGEMGVRYEASRVPGMGEPFYATTIEGLETELHTGPAPSIGDALPYTGRSNYGPGPRLVRTGWFAMITRADRANARGHAYANLFEGEVYPGDIVTLLYSTDLDRDGVPASEERAYGSRDDTPHSDNDGLSDFWEIRESWEVNVVGVPDYAAGPQPSVDDSDADGLSDLAEALAGTDPRMRDTDLDGFSDLQEGSPTYDLDPRRPMESPDLATVSCAASMVVPSHTNSCWISAVPDGGGPRQLKPCYEFTTRNDCRVVGRASAPFECLHADGVSIPRELTPTAISTAETRSSCTGDGTWGCNFMAPLGAGSTCNVAVQHFSAPHGAYEVEATYTIVPCSAFIDVDGDSICENVRGADDVGVELRRDGPPPPCVRFEPELDPYMVLDVFASDPQRDLTQITLRNPMLGVMNHRFTPRADFGFREEVRHTCSASPESFEIIATDAYGLSSSTRCAWAAGVTCRP